MDSKSLVTLLRTSNDVIRLTGWKFVPEGVFPAARSTMDDNNVFHTCC